jgi:glutathione S-transferase
MNEPDELLHIALPDDWTAAREQGEYRVSTRGRGLDEEGFIHCSYLRQVDGVANRFYADVVELVLLHIEPELLHAEVRVEPAGDGGTERFPHVYGPIPTSAVIATTWWERGDDGMWHRPHIM